MSFITTLVNRALADFTTSIVPVFRLASTYDGKGKIIQLSWVQAWVRALPANLNEYG